MEELKDLVIQTLDNNGVLNKIRAQLRANVFSAIEQENQDPNESSEASKVMMTEEGQIAVELVRDFLECFQLENTLRVFVPECKLPETPRDKTYLTQKLNVEPDNKLPVLSALVANRKSFAPVVEQPESNLPQRALEENKQQSKLPAMKQPPNLKLPPMDLPKQEEELRYSEEGPHSSPSLDQEQYTEEFEDDIEEDIVEELSEPKDSVGNPVLDSMGTSSMGVDASVNSMTLEGYDHVEPVTKIAK